MPCPYGKKKGWARRIPQAQLNHRLAYPVLFRRRGRLLAAHVVFWYSRGRPVPSILRVVFGLLPNPFRFLSRAA
jgi:hypothetical protein